MPFCAFPQGEEKGRAPAAQGALQKKLAGLFNRPAVKPPRTKVRGFRWVQLAHFASVA
jgi:hypothetical protein